MMGRTMTIASGVLAFTLAGLLVPSLAEARYGSRSQGYADDAGYNAASGRMDGDALVEGVVPGVRQADGRACVKQCPQDMLPCDPPVFKQADGRCSFER